MSAPAGPRPGQRAAETCAAGRPIRDPAGLLTLGYGYAQPALAEQYNAPGSPYWALKAFLPLAVPAEHPFWTSPEHTARELLCVIEDLSGARAGRLVRALPGTNVLVPRTVIPTLAGGHGPGEHWPACAVLGLAQAPPAAEWPEPPGREAIPDLLGGGPAT